MTASPPDVDRPRADPLAALPRVDRHKPKCGPVRKSKVGRWRALVLIAVHVIIGIHLLHWLSAGATITPVEPSEAMQTLELGRVNAGFVFFAVAIFGTLVFGRWFCGWACHVVALQDLSAWLLGRLGLRPRPVRSRVLILAPFVVAFHMFAWPTVERLWVSKPALDWQPAFTTSRFWETFPGWLMGTATLLVVGFLVVWWLGAKGFCNYGCPYGAFFGMADRLAPVRIKVTDACDACGHCTSVCTSNVRVHEEVAVHKMIADPACMKCLDCVSVCPKEALYVGFALPKPLQVSRQRVRARADFTWPEELLLGGVALVATQWCFRGAWLGDSVPLLLSVGLGAITAAVAVLVLRLVSRAEVTFQRTVLRAGGVRTRAGTVAVAASAAWLAFTVYTGVVQQTTSAATEKGLTTLAEIFIHRRDVPPEKWREASSAMVAADRMSWLSDPRLLGVLGLVLRGEARHEEALTALQRAHSAYGTDTLGKLMPRSATALAMYEADLRSDFAAARALVDAVLAHNAGDATAQVVRQRLEAMGK